MQVKMFIMIVGGKEKPMEKQDATWKNIEEVLNNIEGEIESAESFANDAQNAAGCASDQMSKLKKLLKIRKEYDDLSFDRDELMFYVDSMQNSVSDLADNIVKLKKGR